MPDDIIKPPVGLKGLVTGVFQRYGAALNNALYRVGVEITAVRVSGNPDARKKSSAGFDREFEKFKKSSARPFKYYRQYHFDGGVHPANYVDFECAFAAKHLMRLNPEKLLDVGSYRHFVIGLLAARAVTTVDVRPRMKMLENETILVCDSKKLDLPDACVDAVVSLCAVEHFGLGRYGDDIDPEADFKAVKEMMRVVAPGGHLILTTTITGGAPFVAFNVHRVYNHAMITEMTRPMICQDEAVFSISGGGFTGVENAARTPRLWDIYCGCFRKPAAT
jgi:SAM-dependent methyltransferase